MGITGLLPFLEKASKRTNVSDFSGGVVAIDTYCWLHKGVFSCAEKVMMGQTTNAYVLYCAKFINMLLKYHIKPILVFDGRQLPAKEKTEIKRRESRQMNRRKAFELIKMGQDAEGKNLLKRAIDITHEMALELIKYCQSENIDCIVAPYEADAQLAYLNISGIADLVITEDSDLTLFGCKKIFFKMDLNGNGVLIEQDRLHLAMDMRPEQFNMDKFRYTCILSGCDYLPSLPGIGLGKARKFIMKNTDSNIHRALIRVGSVLNMKSLEMTQEYRDAFILADITFKHQLVFCPLQRKQVRLNLPSADITEDQLRYAGQELDADLALQLALGNCDPCTLKMLHDFNPDKIERKRKRTTEMGRLTMNHVSIWSSEYELKNKSKEKSQTLFFGNAMNSFITTARKQTSQRVSLKDEFVPSKSDNSLATWRDNASEHQNVNENILDIYNCQDAKLIASPEQKPEQTLYLENNTSPELSRQRNPFVKRISELTTSPSVLSSGNYRQRGRNLMRIRRTIINENTIVESRYFSKKDNEEHDAVKLENSIEDINSESLKSNIIADVNTDVHNIYRSHEEAGFAENAVASKNLSEAFSTDHNESTTEYENVYEKSYSDDRITEISSTIQCTKINDSYDLDNLLVSSSSNVKPVDDLINHENTGNLQDLRKWSSTKSCKVVSHKKIENSKRQSTSNLTSPKSNSVIKQTRQNKRLASNLSQQSLLSMYGFQKRFKIRITSKAATMMTLIIAILILLLIFIALNKRRRANFPPGPFPWPFVGNQSYLKELSQKFGGQHRAFLELSKLYNSGIISLRLGNDDVIVVTDNELILKVLNNEEYDGRPWNEFTKIRNMGMKKGITMNDGLEWKELRHWTVRNLRNVGFAKRKMEELLLDELVIVIDKLKQHNVLRIKLAVETAVINVLWKLLTGQQIFINANPQDFITLLERRAKAFQLGGGVFSSFPWLRHIMPKAMGYNIIYSLNKELKSLLMTTIEAHKQRYTKGAEEDFIDLFLREMVTKETKTEVPIFTDDNLLVTLIDFFIAGTNNTTSTLDFLFFHMVKHQDVQEKLHKEIDNVIGSERLPRLEDRINMPFTEAVLTECQRMWVVTPIIGPRRVLADTTLGGYTIRKNTIVLMDIFANNMDSKLYSDPTSFKPERFIKNNAYQSDDNVITFGKGKRRCPGEALAKSAIFLLFVGVMQKYRLLPPPDKESLELEIIFGLTIMPKPYKVLLVPR
ncbi:exonuclease 1 [Odontomachus brunneus]|uniref:exonuclease 1 n=1 Tax=Odontomachus brunneus TaxID=486640 RepID=UPI0013F24F71|nr:exonuclease 1 [Odontomachus brunneus]